MKEQGAGLSVLMNERSFPELAGIEHNLQGEESVADILHCSSVSGVRFPLVCVLFIDLLLTIHSSY